MKEEEFSELRHLLKEAIRASNRTTHAVRSIARPIWVLILTVLFSFPWIFIAVIAQTPLPLIFVAGTLLIGTIASIVVLRAELAKSGVPDSVLPARPKGPLKIKAEAQENTLPPLEPQFWSERSWKLATPLSGTTVEDFNTKYWKSLSLDEKEKVASIFRLLTRDERGLWHVSGQPDLVSLEEAELLENWLERVSPRPLDAWKQAGKPPFASWKSGEFQTWLSEVEN